jgi:hypothetical protein
MGKLSEHEKLIEQYLSEDNKEAAYNCFLN